jgi:chromosome segregation ATPase
VTPRTSPTSGSGNASNTAAVNAATADLTAARQREATAQDGIDVLQDAADSLTSDAAAAESGLDRAKTAHETAQSELEASNTAVTTAQTAVDSAETELDAANTAVTTAEAELKTAQESVKTTQAELDAATEKVEAAKAKVETATEKVETAQTKVETATEKVETATEKVETATKAVETAQERVDTATEKVETATKAVETAQARVDTAQQAVEAAQTRVDAAQTRVDTAQQAVDAAQTRVDTAQQAVDTAQTRVDSAQTRVDSATTAVETAQGELDAANEAVTTAENGVTEADAELAAANEAVTAAQADVTAADANVTAKQGELTAATAAVGAAQGRVDGARGAVSSAEGALSAAERDLRNAEARLRANPDDPAAKAAVNSARARVNTARTALNNARTELRNAEAALREAQAAEQRAREALAQAEREAAAARQRLAEAEERKRQAEAAKAQAEEALRQAQAAQQAAQQALETAQAELEAAQTELTEATTALETAEAELETAQAELETAQTELETAQTELETAQEELETAQAELEEAQTELETAQEEFETAQAELEEAQAELETAQAELETAEAELETAEAELETAEAELEAAETELETAETELKTAETELEAAETALEEAEAALEEAETAVEEAEAAAEKAQTALDEAKTELDEAKSKQTELKAAVDEAKAELDSKQQEVDQLKQQADAKTAQLAEARSRLTAAKSEVSAAEAALDQARKAPADAPQPDVEGDSNKDGILSQAERDALADAANLDGALTPAEVKALQDQQAELLAAEQAAQARYTDVDGTVTDSTSAGAQGALNSELEAQAEAEIADERRRYYQENPYYVDANGEVFAASVDASGNLVLKRNSSQPPQGQDPQVDTARTTTIQTDRNRTDVAVHTNVPRTPEEPRQTRTETVNTNPAGERTGSQISLEQERDNADGSSERSYTEETYDAANVATQRVEEQSRTEANGDQTSDRVTTAFREDGTTPRSTVAEHDETRGETQSSRETSTWYRPDGATPERQVVESSGTDEPTTRAETDYLENGDPNTTYITRDGELANGTPPSEYIVWDGEEVGSRRHGGPDTTRSQFEEFVADGTQPPTQDVPPEPTEPDPNDWEGGAYYGLENEAGLTYQEAYEQWESQHERWDTERGEIEAANEASRLSEVDADYIAGAGDPIEYTRQDNNRFEGREFGGNLVAPLEASTSVPSVFDVPAQLQARANADAIDSRFTDNPQALSRLDEQQAVYEAQLDGATTDVERERIMREYFSTHSYWIDRGENGEAPVVLASTWSDGAPQSDMFGSTRAADPHAVAARTGIQGVDDQDQPATIDVVQRFYADGSQDDVVRTSFEGPAGASRTVVTGEHSNENGVVTEFDRHAETMVPRIDQGLDPLAVTEISRERFADELGADGEPIAIGEQYHAVATTDDTMTSLEEQRDYYTSEGIIYDSKIESTQMSRNFDEDLTEDFLAANAAQIQRALDDDLDINDDGTSITTPPVGAFYTHSETDIDYDENGVAIFQEVEDETVTVAAADDDNGNGVRVTSTDTTRTTGERGGSAPIFDADGNRIVDEDVVTTISTNEFDPDAGSAGGNNGEGFQFRESTQITLGSTNRPDGTQTNQWATPLTINTLMEGHDDDWVFTEQFLETNGRGELVNGDGEPLGDGDEPVKLGEGDEVYNAAGERITLERDGRSREDLDFADKFEEFMEGWGGKIIGVAGVVAGVALIATGVGSPLGVALAAGGVALATTQFAYTALNYSQGEASGFDLAIAGAGVAFSAIPAITGVRQLANAGRLANSARAGVNAIDDVARAGVGAAGGTRTAGQQALRVVNTTETGLDAYDGYDATRAALQGDFYGAALMLGAIGAGRAVSGRVNGGTPDVDAGGTPRSTRTPDAPNASPDVPDLPDTGAPSGANGGGPLAGGALGNPDLAAPGTGTAQGAPSVSMPASTPAASSQPLPGTSTGSSTPGTSPAPASASASGSGPAPTPPTPDGTGPVPVFLTDTAGARSNVTTDVLRGSALDPTTGIGARTQALEGASQVSTNIPEGVEADARFRGHVAQSGHLRRQDEVLPVKAPSQERLDYTPPQDGSWTPPAGSRVFVNLVQADGQPLLDRSGKQRTQQYYVGADGLAYRLTSTDQINTNVAPVGVADLPGGTTGANQSWRVPKTTFNDAVIDGVGDGSLEDLTMQVLRSPGTRVVQESTFPTPTRVLRSDVGTDIGFDVNGNPISVVELQLRLVDGPNGQPVWARESIYPYDANFRHGTEAGGADAAPGPMAPLRNGDDPISPDAPDLDAAPDAPSTDGRGRIDRIGNRHDSSSYADSPSQHFAAAINGGSVRVRLGDGSLGDGYRIVSAQGDFVNVRRVGEGQSYAIHVSQLADINADRMGAPRTARPDGSTPPARFAPQAMPGWREFSPQTIEGIELQGYEVGSAHAVRHGAVTITVETPDGVLSDTQLADVDRIRDQLDALPAELRDSISQVRVMSGRNPLDAYWQQKYAGPVASLALRVPGVRRLVPEFNSAATGGSQAGVMTFWKGDVPNRPLTFWHEAGHISGVNNGPVSDVAWKQAMEADYDNPARAGWSLLGHTSSNSEGSFTASRRLGLFRREGVSTYADSSYRNSRTLAEDWAESVALFTQSRAQGYIATRVTGPFHFFGIGNRTRLTFADVFPTRNAILEGYYGTTPTVPVGPSSAGVGAGMVTSSPIGRTVSVQRSSGAIEGGWVVAASLTNGRYRVVAPDGSYKDMRPEALADLNGGQGPW